MPAAAAGAAASAPPSNSCRGWTPAWAPSRGVFRSPSALFWLALHAVCCVISLLLGFRFSRLLFTYPSSSSTVSTLLPIPIPLPTSASHRPPPPPPQVVVGRHGIRVESGGGRGGAPHRLIKVVQREQRVQYVVKSRRPLIVVTPTHVTLHLTGLAHTLMLLPL